MRRSDREVHEPSRIFEILQNCDCCRLGFVDRGEAYIVPMNFGYEQNGNQLVLYFHSANEGRKLDLLRTNTTLTFEMDTGHRLLAGVGACDFSFHYRSIMGRGAVTLLHDDADKRRGLAHIMEHYTGKTNWEFPAEALRAVTLWKLTVGSYSCKER